MASVSESRIIAAAPAEVWGVLADVENAQRWNGAWTRIEITSPQRHGLGTTFIAQTESGDQFTFEISEWSAREKIAFSPIRDEGETYGVVLDSHTFTLSPAGEDATHVKLTARATAHGLRGHLVTRVFWPGHQKQGLRMALDALQAVFEPETGDEEEEEAAEAGSPASD
jgi:uncharacterized protein YndB with AHSA1/START domain